MKLLLTILLFPILIEVEAQTVVTDTVKIELGSNQNAASAIPVDIDGNEAVYKKGSMKYTVKSYTVCKVEKTKSDERFFYINPLKAGKSVVTVSLVRMDGKPLSKSFIVVVTDAKMATGFKVQVLSL